LEKIKLPPSVTSASQLLGRYGGKERLPWGIKSLDQFLEGGLPVGEITEIGLPLDCEGRRLILSLLAQSTRRGERSLWVYSENELNINPPAWQAFDVDLSLIRFARSGNPLVDFQPLFLEPIFKVLVLDSPSELGEESLAFLTARIRENGQSLLILRDYFLDNKRGNIWAKLRLNCSWGPAEQVYYLDMIRGTHPRHLKVRKEELGGELLI